jgi:hypothetical protein
MKIRVGTPRAMDEDMYDILPAAIDFFTWCRDEYLLQKKAGVILTNDDFNKVS